MRNLVPKIGTTKGLTKLYSFVYLLPKSVINNCLCYSVFNYNSHLINYISNLCQHTFGSIDWEIYGLLNTRTHLSYHLLWFRFQSSLLHMKGELNVRYLVCTVYFLKMLWHHYLECRILTMANLNSVQQQMKQV